VRGSRHATGVSESDPAAARFAVRGNEVRVTGELDLDTAPQLYVSTMVVGDPGTTVRLDMSEVTFIDASAIRVLVKVGRQRGVVVVNPSPPVRRLLEITGLGERFGLSRRRAS